MFIYKYKCLYIIYNGQANLIKNIKDKRTKYGTDLGNIMRVNEVYPKNNIGRNLGYPRGDYILCTLCNFYIKKSHYSHHCMDCDICIENYDHHCPWTGHCIGKNNKFTFFILLFNKLSSKICFSEFFGF